MFFKPNKICADKGTEFYDRSMKSFLQNNNIEVYLTHNGGKSVVAERFINYKEQNTWLQYQKMCTIQQYIS